MQTMRLFPMLPLSYCHELFLVIDEKLKDIHQEVQGSKDPESDGLCDRGELLAGFGFVLIQKWLESYYSMYGVRKQDALKLDPEIREGLTFAKLTDAAADFWKHEEEIKNNCLKEKSSPSFDIIAQVTDNPHYPLTDVLIALNKPRTGFFVSLLPKMEVWEASFSEHLSRKKAST